MNNHHQDNTLMSLDEFRALTHLSVSTERRLRGENKNWPPSIEIGRKVFYRRSTVERWLAELEVRG